MQTRYSKCFSKHSASSEDKAVYRKMAVSPILEWRVWWCFENDGDWNLTIYEQWSPVPEEKKATRLIYLYIYA